MNLLAIYIHNLDPIIFDIPGTPLALRWYGLSYVMSFLVGYLVLLALSKRNLYCVNPEKLSDFITSTAIFGALMGGRLGEFFFYWLPKHGWSGFIADPSWVFRVWEGGMASHGGILGVFLVALYYSRKYKWPILNLCDGLAIASSIGLCFGRIANFINGELYGRLAPEQSATAMKFPLELHEICARDPQRWNEIIQSAITIEPTILNGVLSQHELNNKLIELMRSNEELRYGIGEQLSLRYPSQLFEAAAEGLIIFIILLSIRLIWRNIPAGFISALFCLLYAAGRISTEFYREPDAETWNDITRGQYLSVAVIFGAIAFFIPAWRKWRANKK